MVARIHQRSQMTSQEATLLMNKITDKVKRILPDNLSLFDFILYVFVVTSCYILFQQTDLFHTSSSSYAYLNGHIADYYDYNNKIIAGEDPFYLPLIYIIFAIWNIPLKLFGLMHDVSVSGVTLSIVELAWTKLLIVIFYFATAFVIFLMGKSISGQSQKAKYIAVIFATSPMAIFAAFIFGQYDIIGVFFTMLGLYFYIKHDYFRFSLFFSLAISLKMFPLVIFIPLLLLVEKRIVHIIKYGVVALAATLLQIVIYYNNAAFRSDFFSVAGGRISFLEELNLSPVNSSPYLIILITMICIYAYIKEVDLDSELYKTAINISLLSYASLFSTVFWHPQWLLMIVPFFALSYLFVKDVSKSYLIDIAGMLSFIYIVVNQWEHNVDVSMLSHGILRLFFTYIPLSTRQLFLPQFSHIFMGIFFVYLFSPLLIQLFQATDIIKQNVVEGIHTSNNYLRARFYIGVAIFVIPSLFCAFAPKEIARKLDPTAYTIAGLVIQPVDAQVGDINRNTSVKQSFVAEHDNLFDVNVQLDTWNRVNTCEVTLTLSDDKNNIMAVRKLDCKLIVDNAFYSFDFNPIETSKGEMYYIEISSNGTSKNSITAWKSSQDVYPPGKLYKNGKEETGDLSIALFYER
jgi:Gpi18-like mannosyltransferase